MFAVMSRALWPIEIRNLTLTILLFDRHSLFGYPVFRLSVRFIGLFVC